MGCVDSKAKTNEETTKKEIDAANNYKAVHKTHLNEQHLNEKKVEMQETTKEKNIDNVGNNENESKEKEEQQLITRNESETQIKDVNNSDSGEATNKQKEYKIVVQPPENNNDEHSEPSQASEQEHQQQQIQPNHDISDNNESLQKEHKIVVQPSEQENQQNDNESDESIQSEEYEHHDNDEYEADEENEESPDDEQQTDDDDENTEQSDHEETEETEQKQNENDSENEYEQSDEQSNEIENEESEESEQEEYKIENIDEIFATFDRKKDENKNMKACNALKRIAIILRDYKIWMDTMDMHEKDHDEKMQNTDIKSIIYKYASNYSLIELLNDFYFLLFEHSTDIELENMYNNICDILQCKPNIDNCSSIKRNQRDKSIKYDEQMNRFYYGISDNKQIITVQILDNIYCYFLHSFDILFKLLSNEKLQIEQQINEQKEQYNEEKDEINITDINLLETSRFVQDFQTFEAVRGQKRLKRNKYLRRTNNKQINNFVEMFVYGNDQKGETMYVKPKYDTLKTELTENMTCHMDIKQWDEIYEKANVFIQTNHCKHNIKPNKTMFADVYQIDYKNATISNQQLIAISVYSNFEVLQRKFSKTYVRKKRSEDVDDVIERHSSFAIFGRLLRECVEVFGTELNKKCKYNSFYHGINAELTLFNKSFCDYSGPLSTSSNYKVILNYVINSNGLIVELNKGRKEDVFYFNCEWLSDQINEEEKLFFFDGGQRLDINTPIYGQVLRIQSLLNVSLGHNYSIYATALNVITHLMDAKNYYSDLVNNTNNINEETKNVIYKLLMHQMYKQNKHKNENNFTEFKTIPKYIDNVLDSLCNSRTKINIDWIQMNEETQNKFLFDLLCTNNDEFNEEDMMGFINIDRFKLLFPLLTKIEVRYIFLSDTIIYNIFKHIESDESLNKLKELTIRDPGQQSLSIEQALQQYADKFEDKNYNMYEWEGDSGMLKYLTFQNMDAAYDDSGDDNVFSDVEENDTDH